MPIASAFLQDCHQTFIDSLPLLAGVAGGSIGSGLPHFAEMVAP
jgi:hypothetical protein